MNQIPKDQGLQNEKEKVIFPSYGSFNRICLAITFIQN